GRHNRPATILRELEESRPPGALLRFVRLAALGSLRYARPPAAEAEAPAHTTRRGASMADEVQLTLAVFAPRAWGPPQTPVFVVFGGGLRSTMQNKYPHKCAMYRWGRKPCMHRRRQAERAELGSVLVCCCC